MVAVRDLMQPGVVSVAPELSLRDLVEFLAQQHVSGVPVRSGSRLVGVVSASDVLSFLASEPPVPEEQLDYVEQDEVEPALEWVEGAEAPSAYFTDLWEDVGAELPERFQRIQGGEWDLLEEHTVAEAMSRTVATIEPGASLAQAARALLDRHLHRLMVVERGDLVGILTTSDLVRAIAEGRLAARSGAEPPGSKTSGGRRRAPRSTLGR